MLADVKQARGAVVSMGSNSHACKCKSYRSAETAALEAAWLAAEDQPEAWREASAADAEALMAADTRCLQPCAPINGPV